MVAARSVAGGCAWGGWVVCVGKSRIIAVQVPPVPSSLTAQQVVVASARLAQRCRGADRAALVPEGHRPADRWSRSRSRRRCSPSRCLLRQARLGPSGAALALWPGSPFVGGLIAIVTASVVSPSGGARRRRVERRRRHHRPSWRTSPSTCPSTEPRTSPRRSQIPGRTGTSSSCAGVQAGVDAPSRDSSSPSRSSTSFFGTALPSGSGSCERCHARGCDPASIAPGCEPGLSSAASCAVLR